MRRTLVAAIVIACACASPAFAGGPPGSVTPETPEAAPTHVERYGKWVFIADLIRTFGTTVIAGPLADDHEELALGVLAVGFAGTGAAVHLYHGNRNGAVKSVLARVLLPVGGAFAGSELIDGSSEDAWVGALLGGTLGGLTALVLDWSVFSKQTVEGRRPSWAVAPRLSVTRDAAVAGVGGTF